MKQQEQYRNASSSTSSGSSKSTPVFPYVALSNPLQLGISTPSLPLLHLSVHSAAITTAVVTAAQAAAAAQAVVHQMRCQQS
jgi:hypothetical protein